MATMLSPRDPIFFLHHANIDRIWASWNRQGGSTRPRRLGATAPSPTISRGANGTLYSIAVRNISDAAYLYDSYDPAPASAQVASTFAPEAEWIQVATAGPLTGLLSDTTSKVRVANRNRATLGRPATIPVGLQGCRRSGKQEAVVRLIWTSPRPRSPMRLSCGCSSTIRQSARPCRPRARTTSEPSRSSAPRRSVGRCGPSRHPRGSGSALRICASPTPTMPPRRRQRASRWSFH